MADPIKVQSAFVNQLAQVSFLSEVVDKMIVNNSKFDDPNRAELNGVLDRVLEMSLSKLRSGEHVDWPQQTGGVAVEDLPEDPFVADPEIDPRILDGQLAEFARTVIGTVTIVRSWNRYREEGMAALEAGLRRALEALHRP